MWSAWRYAKLFKRIRNIIATLVPRIVFPVECHFIAKPGRLIPANMLCSSDKLSNISDAKQLSNVRECQSQEDDRLLSMLYANQTSIISQSWKRTGQIVRLIFHYICLFTSQEIHGKCYTLSESHIGRQLIFHQLLELNRHSESEAEIRKHVFKCMNKVCLCFIISWMLQKKNQFVTFSYIFEGIKTTPTD